MIILLATGIQVVYAAFSFTGITDEKSKSSKYSLKNLSALSHKGLSFSSVRLNLQYRGLQPIKVNNDNSEYMEVKSMLRYDNGHTTYNYPYTFRIKTPKFKTPTPQQN